jgi:hypothetical protein
MAQHSTIQAYVASQLATAEDQVAALQRLGHTPSAHDVAGRAGVSVFDALREVLARYLLPLWPLILVGLLPALTALGSGVVPALGSAAGLPPAWSALLPAALRLLVAAWTVVLLGRGLLRGARSVHAVNPRVVRLLHRQHLVLTLLALLALLVPLAPGPAGHLPGWVYWTLDAVPVLAALLMAVYASLLRGLPPLAASVSQGGGALPTGGMVELQERIARLKQMQEWLTDDKLRVLVDETIGKQVKQSERRQATFGSVIAVVSLVVGWLLSAITPASALAGLLGHTPH